MLIRTFLVGGDVNMDLEPLERFLHIRVDPLSIEWGGAPICQWKRGRKQEEIERNRIVRGEGGRGGGGERETNIAIATLPPDQQVA
jgi:hypothetical protein